MFQSLESLVIAFFFISWLYSMAGFGGGSSYIGLLVLFGTFYQVAPVISLFCNIIVVSIGTLNFFKNRLLNLKKLTPFLMGSIPMSYLGGLIVTEKLFYQTSLIVFLFISAARMLAMDSKGLTTDSIIHTPSNLKHGVIGSLIGLASGFIGIGGGIFLSPVLYHLRTATPKQISASTSFFILVNSIFALSGHLSKGIPKQDILEYWPLFVSVAIGASLGGHMIKYKLSQKNTKNFTAVLLLLVALKLSYDLY